MSELKEVMNVMQVSGERIPSGFYKKSEAGKVIAEKDREIAELKKKLMPCLNGDCILTCEVVEKYGKENAELKKENERLKKKMDDYHLMSDIRRAKIKELKRALWLARAEWARSSALSYHLIESHPDKDVAETYKRKANKWEKAKDKCLKKAEEYK